MTSKTFPQGPEPSAILVPLDGSEFAEQAVAVGAAHARRTGASLHLVGVHEPLPPMAIPAHVPPSVGELNEQALADLQQYLTSAATVVRETVRSPVTGAVLIGAPARALCTYVETHGVDLVVMTTHGRTGLSRLWLGSVADRMLRRLAVPLLLLRPDGAPHPTEFRRLLVALDGEIEEPLMRALAAIGARPGVTRCVLTRIVVPTLPIVSGLAARPGHLPPDWTAKRVIDARNHLSRVAEPMVRAGWEVEWEVVVGRGVAAEILALAKASAADCIVVGTHGAQGMERLLLGSVADKVVRGAEIPVLVAPAGHPDAEEREPARSEATVSRAISSSSSVGMT